MLGFKKTDENADAAVTSMPITLELAANGEDDDTGIILITPTLYPNADASITPFTLSKIRVSPAATNVTVAIKEKLNGTTFEKVKADVTRTDDFLSIDLGLGEDYTFKNDVHLEITNDEASDQDLIVQVEVNNNRYYHK